MQAEILYACEKRGVYRRRKELLIAEIDED